VLLGVKIQQEELHFSFFLLARFNVLKKRQSAAVPIGGLLPAGEVGHPWPGSRIADCAVLRRQRGGGDQDLVLPRRGR
jgi:hypothetical protein